jgi:DNA-binding protein WhiA
MSFSREVKEEIYRHIDSARHCRIAEIAALISMCGSVEIQEDGHLSLELQTENVLVIKKYFTLLQKTYNIMTETSIENDPYLKKGSVYTIVLNHEEDTMRVLEAVRLVERQDDLWKVSELMDPVVFQKDCCKRAFVRGAFLASGSISDPRKFYHFEIVCQTSEQAQQLCGVIRSFQLDAKIVFRKKSYVVYIKEGEQISELLAIMGAGISLMNFENIRILKEIGNSVNRQVNCETANMKKTANAAVKQMDDIHYIEETVGVEILDDNLKEIARLRMQHPEATLKELGTMLSSPVGKSGVNHRLRKISAIAQELRGSKEEHCYD